MIPVLKTLKASDTASHLAAWMIGSVRVNRVSPGNDQSGDRLEKIRRFGAGPLIILGNEFLNRSASQVEMFRDVNEWIRWEQYCSRLLYPAEAVPEKVGTRAISMRVAGGVSLAFCLDLPDLAAKAFAASGRELRRIHALDCGHFGDFWSHGDLHADNVLYDTETGDVTVIDFDARHCRGSTALFRHTDDLKTLLLGVIGRPVEIWTEPVIALLAAYGVRDVLIELRRQLVVPQGWASILLQTRTRCLPRPVLKDRFAVLSSLLLDLIESSRQVESESAASVVCRGSAQ